MKTKFIRDNVHGEICINEQVIMELIETKAFQRLRRVVQLGGGQFVFPSASHTRFSHSIGTYHVICKFLENENIKSFLNDGQPLLLKVAGLLHDIGHGPFSHSFEGIITKKHEQYSAEIIKNDVEISQILDKFNINKDEVSQIVLGVHKNKILNSLVSSQIDADRIDYLLRDSIGAGVNYSKLDLQWIIRHAMVVDGQICFPEKTINAIEHFLLGRYHMFTQVYNHKISRAFDFTFKSWFKRLKELYKSKFNFKNNYYLSLLKPILEDKDLTIEEYIRLDDYSIIEFIKISKEENDYILSDLANRLINRKFVNISYKITEVEYNNYIDKFVNENPNIDKSYYFDTKIEDKFCVYQVDNKSSNIIYIFKGDNKYEISNVSDILSNESSKISTKFYIFIK
ncbi:HD superfamily phosphohydrolase [Spiroplasma litorale]|uniref:HD superfamily phosphohydrolase n=1 Tax=Spiroplasma litorale TaxID=216942 RepID=A0A0K1W3J6_9MOLU|nr:HD domain-containing protein [Spiroplasma litorale]AKX34682.1 HD superfamily phosphohydrolase [Spiroplasma litorale]